MSEWTTIAVLYLLGMILLIAELFLPAHGLLGLVGLGMLGFGIYETYIHNETAGLVGLGAVAVLLPLGLVISVKVWHRTPLGRRISPPNPVLTEKDRMPVEELRQLIGKHGRAVTLLRPVGMCLFDGRRLECTSEQGVIQSGVEVKVIRLIDRTLSVRPVHPPELSEPANETTGTA
ncbi:MAG TPA: NfeD family protein [Phycisphaerae bacterium]|nr:NfeD family protein [Phycisphaerae bacterium]